MLDPRADAVEKRELPDRRVDRLVVYEPLDAMQRRLASLGIDVRCLLGEQPVDVRIAAVDIRAAGRQPLAFA